MNAAGLGGGWPIANGDVAAVVSVPVAGGIITLSPLSPQPDQAPEYERTAAELGGGSVGVVPFTVHSQSCSPPRNYSTPPIFLNSAFHHNGPAQPETVTLTLRGPVRVDDLEALPFTVTRLDEPGATDYAPMMTIDVKRGQGGAYSNEISFHGAPEFNGVPTLIGPGWYGVKFRRTPGDPGRLICDAMLNGLATTVADLPAGQEYDYVFGLLSDCNLNGWEDGDEIAADWRVDYWNPNGVPDSCEECSIDLNCDGASNGFDVQAMEEAINGDFSNYCAPYVDFNRDGSENGFDIESAEAAVNGQCP